MPTFFIGDDVIVGFDRRKLLELIDHRVKVCEHCGQKLRVPVGKGTIQVTCPQCSQQFTVNT